MRLRAHLVTLVLATALPLAAFAVIAVILFTRHERAAVERGSIEMARALVAAVDRELMSSVSALQALGASRHLDADDLPGFYEDATRVRAAQPQWRTVRLATPAQVQILDLLRLLGESPSPIVEPRSFEEVVRLGRPAVGDLVRDGVTGVYDVRVRVPVSRAGRLRYVLTAVVEPAAIDQILRRQRLPGDWIGSILDRNGVHVARNRAADRFFARPASPDLRAALARGGEGSYWGRTLEGLPVFAAFSRSEWSGWTVAFGLPEALVEAPLRRSLLALVAGGALFVALGVGLALVVGRRIARPIRALASSAETLGRGEPLPPPLPSGLEEVDVVSRAIEQAGTARRDAEQALQETSETLRALVESSALGLVVTDLDGVVQVWNPAAEAMLGWRRDEVIGRLPPHIGPEAVAAFRENFAPALRGEIVRLEVRRARKDGSPIDLSVATAPLRDGAGLTRGLVTVFADITEQKRAEEELRQSERVIRAVLEGIDDAVFLKDHDGRYLVVNPAGCRAIGRPLGAILGRDDTELFEPETAHRIRERDRVVMETGETHRSELTFRVGGVTRTYLSTKSPRRDPHGRVIGIISISRDVTERKQAEEEREDLLAREQAARGEADRRRQEAEVVAELARGINASLDLDTILLSVAEAARRLCDSDAARIALVDPADDAMVLRYSTGGPTVMPSGFRIGHGKGIGGLAWATGRPVRSDDFSADPRFDAEYAADGIVSCMVVPIRLGDRVEGLIYADQRRDRPFAERDEIALTHLADQAAVAIHNAQLLRSEQALRADAEHANRAKDEFLAMLGHELRNPLGAISNAIAVLQQTARPDDAIDPLRGIIARQTQHLERLVDDLLDVSRVTTGKIVLERRPVELREVVEACLAVLQHAGRARGHDITLAGEPLVVEGDPTRLEQVVANLLDNALKYTPPGGGIRVTLDADGDEAVLRVRDTGLGIAPEMLPHVFEAFVQGHRPLDRPQGGLGLGLTLVKRLVELHGGRVSVSSPGPGHGSEFAVRLPRSTAPWVAPGAAAGRPPAGARRIALIEDHQDAREGLRALLEVWGHHVEEAEDGERGLELLRASRPEVALIDLGLPGLDGYAVARAVRAAPGGSDIYLVALTGYGQPEDRLRVEAAGFDAHLVKPVDPDALQRMLAALGAGRPGGDGLSQ